MQRPKIDIYPVTQFVVQEVSINASNIRRQPSTSDIEGNPQLLKDNTALGKLMRLKQRFDREGGNAIRSVEGVLLFHEHGHPHILLCKHTASYSGDQNGSFNPATTTYTLPGGKCKGDEREVDCLLRKLGRRLLGLPKASVAAAALKSGVNHALPAETKEFPSQSVLASSSMGVEDDESYFNDGKSPSAFRHSQTNLCGPSPRLGAISALTMSSKQTLPSPMQKLTAGGSGSAIPPPLMTAFTNAYALASEYFRIGELLSVWYRPNFDRLLFPYVPPHITSVKERRSVFIVHVDPSVRFLINHAETEQSLSSSVNRDRRKNANLNFGVAHTTDHSHSYELVAVPLFEVYQNAQKYGIIIQAIPDLVSRFHINLC